MNWNRIRTYLFQQQQDSEKVADVLQQLKHIHSVCGDFTKSRQKLQSIGLTLLHEADPTILVPTCPDFSHEDGKYTFRSLESGIPLLAQKHITFLKELAEHVSFTCVFLVADLESRDQKLRNAVGLSESDFLEKVRGTQEKLHESVSQYGWSASMMSAYFPELEEVERVHEREITRSAHDPKASQYAEIRRRIEYQVDQRTLLYETIDPNMGIEDMAQRTVRTASQYVAIGNLAQQRSHIICNHTTTSLCWYWHKEQKPAVLNNPVTIY